MYAGHAGLALLAKSRARRIPMALLVLIAFAPDWIQWLLDASDPARSDGAMVSHSIPSVMLGSVCIAVLLALVGTATRSEAFAAGALYGSHWVVDLITGVKPTWPGGPSIGLGLYDHPVADFVLEAAVIIVCWISYDRSIPLSGRRRAAAMVVPAALLGLQALSLAIMQRLN